MRPAYSKDLRERVIKYVMAGNSYASASAKYEIAKETARNWHIRFKKEGHCNLKPRPGKKSRVIRSEFEEYVGKHSGSTLKQIGEKFKMTARSAHYYMKKFGFSYKKKNLVIWSQNQVKD